MLSATAFSIEMTTGGLLWLYSCRQCAGVVEPYTAAPTQCACFVAIALAAIAEAAGEGWASFMSSLWLPQQSPFSCRLRRSRSKCGRTWTSSPSPAHSRL